MVFFVWIESLVYEQALASGIFCIGMWARTSSRLRRSRPQPKHESLLAGAQAVIHILFNFALVGVRSSCPYLGK